VTPSLRPPARTTIAEAAQALRLLLAAIEEGEIDADDPKALALQRRLEGEWWRGRRLVGCPRS
jgi:hypothetical protein